MRAVATMVLLGLLLSLALPTAGCAEAPYVARAPEEAFVRGVAIGFPSGLSDAGARSTARALSEVSALGAREVSIVVPLYTEGIAGTTVRRGALDDARGGEGEVAEAGVAPAQTVIDARGELDASARSDAQLAALIAQCKRAGLSVLVFPIVRLRVRNPGQWRGRLAPPDRVRWWSEYAAQLEAIADVAQRAGAARLAVGSELVSFEGAEDDWRTLIGRVRSRFSGKLLYSANWDRYRDVPFWDALDEIGISAYFTLAPRGDDPSVTSLVHTWQPIVDDLAALSRSLGRPVLFTEVGFPSVHGAAFWPWNDHQSKHACSAGEGCEGALDLEAQRRLWAAFVRVFGDRERASFLRGLYVWLWAGDGGLRDRGYSPRGKPAQAVIKLWYGGARPFADR